MENSPLTLAYDYARSASAATHASDVNLAISQHVLAAGEFSKAASCTSNIEAMRILRLLENHHRRLSELLSSTTENPSNSSNYEGQKVNAKQSNPSKVVVEFRNKRSDLGIRSSSPLRTITSLQQSRRPIARDLSSSIASNLATARGIRASYTRQPLSPSISKNQASGSVETLILRDGRISSVPTISEYPNSRYSASASGSRKNEAKFDSKNLEKTSKNDEGFSRFYSTFENLVSKLTAPLAFAGLPLTVDGASLSNSLELNLSNKQRNFARERIPADELDLTKLISRAALRASARDDNGVNDSFYVVPTTGHTVSYAHILSFDQKEKRRMAISTNSDNLDVITDLKNDDNDFLDARETLLPLDTCAQRQSNRELNPREKDNKIEELTMENISLKTAIDKLSKRLHTFEVSAQYNSMALAESMRMMRDFSPVRKAMNKGTECETHSEEKPLKQRVQELEEILRAGIKENQHLKKENERLTFMVTRYRERWEKLKEGAKSRREVKDGSTPEN